MNEACPQCGVLMSAEHRQTECSFMFRCDACDMTYWIHETDIKRVGAIMLEHREKHVPRVPPRPPYDAYFMHFAVIAATRSTCDRRHVGCVIVRDGRVLSTGYNGSLPGAPHCDDDGHLLVDGHCVRTVHAEANAVAHAARTGTSLHLATAYVTVHPCPDCLKMLASSGICRIVHLEPYHAHKDEVSKKILAEYNHDGKARMLDVEPYAGTRPWLRGIER